MKNLMEELTINYDLIMKTDNEELTKTIKFSEDVMYAFEVLMQTINKAYVKNIIKNKNIRVFLKKDPKGNAYLKITGRDRNTKLIIRSNNSRYSSYVSIEGYKVTEKEFARTIDIIQRERLAKANIPKRFIKEEIPEVNLYEEMEIEKFLSNCKEVERLQNEPETTLYFDEPENAAERKTRRTPSFTEPKERMNSVVPYELRKAELTKYNQKKILRFRGKKTNKVFDAYIYIKNGYILAIVEPLSGLGYQYNLNLGFAENYNEELIQEMIKASLETEENIVLKDDAIIRKNHTTIENFKDNIKIFLNHTEEDKRFLQKVESASNVYTRVRK